MGSRQEQSGEGQSRYPLLDTDSGITLEQPDFDQLRLDRLERNRQFLKTMNPTVTAQMLPELNIARSKEDEAAICIQKHYRGFLGRKKYAELLYEQFTQEEKLQLEKIHRQIEEGELLIENHKLEVLLDDGNTARRNRLRSYIASVITIQREWRAYLRRTKGPDTTRHVTKGHICSSTSKADGDEVCKTGSAKGNQATTLSPTTEITEETHLSSDNAIHLSEKELRNSGRSSQEKDIECDSVLSDYSEVTDPLKDFAESEVDILLTKDLRDSHVKLYQKPVSPIERNLYESDDDYSRRLRKINFLSLAQEFAELKKLDADALPFNLHKSQNNFLSPLSESGSVTDSEAATPMEINDNITLGDLNKNFSSEFKSENGQHKDMSNSNGVQSSFTSVSTRKDLGNSEKIMNLSPKRLPKDGASEGSKRRSNSEDQEGGFDVYNIETTLPHMDWEALEQSLRLAAEEEQQRLEARQNDREEIRKKLAMGPPVETEDYYGEEKAYKKPNLQTRLQSGMNLQICFMNESSPGGDSESGELEGENHRMSADSAALPTEEHKKSKDVHCSVSNVSTKSSVSKEEETNHSSQSKPEDDNDDTNFFSRRERLQQEAKLALAQASTMAHMQLEVEKQMKKKSPIAEIVGIPGFSDGKKWKLKQKLLQGMNVAQLQVVVNDIHTQIENLNEELVKLLMERDELHMEQDSKLVDIEDLSRRAEECAQRVNKKTKDKKK